MGKVWFIENSDGGSTWNRTKFIWLLLDLGNMWKVLNVTLKLTIETGEAIHSSQKYQLGHQGHLL